MISCVPTAKSGVVIVAWPETRGTLLSRVSPVVTSVNVTAPVAAVPVAGPVVIVTVAVNVTTWLNTEGFGEASSTVVVWALVTTWLTEPLLPVNSVVPL